MRVQFGKTFVVLAGDDLHGGFRDCGSVTSGDHFVGIFAIDLNASEALLASQVAEVAGVFPTGNVHICDGVRQGRVGALVEFLDDLAGTGGIVQHGVDDVAESFGELCDFALGRLDVRG